MRLDRRTTSKRGLCHEPALEVCSESQAGEDVLRLQVREVGQDLLLRHTGCEVAEDVIDSDPHSPDTRLSASHVGIYGEALFSLCSKSTARDELDQEVSSCLFNALYNPHSHNAKIRALVLLLERFVLTRLRLPLNSTGLSPILCLRPTGSIESLSLTEGSVSCVVLPPGGI